MCVCIAKAVISMHSCGIMVSALLSSQQEWQKKKKVCAFIHTVKDVLLTMCSRNSTGHYSAF